MSTKDKMLFLQWLPCSYFLRRRCAITSVVAFILSCDRKLWRNEKTVSTRIIGSWDCRCRVIKSARLIEI